MSMSGDDAYVLAMDYVDETLEGGGALKGDDGKSAYQSWLDLGNTGTEEDFINSLKGEGVDGFSPVITENSNNTYEDYRLDIETKESKFTTPNLKADIRKNIAEHNTSPDSHNDIRIFLNELNNRLNALANSDDETLDEMKEVVAYIKDNRSLIESITTTKVNVADIIDNLTTNVSNKPLSASQGVVIKNLIDTLQSELTAHANNADIHVTASDKTNWNNKLNKAVTNLGDMSGKTITDLRSSLTNWISSNYNIPNARASFAGDMSNIMNLWNSNNLSDGISGGRTVTAEMESYYIANGYSLIKFTTYAPKEVYYVSKQGDAWNSLCKVAFTEDLQGYSQKNHTHEIADVNGLQTIADNSQFCSANLSKQGWYRIAEYSDGDINTARGSSCNSCEIIIKRLYINNSNEEHRLLLKSKFLNQKFVPISCNSNTLGFTKIRYVYNSTTAYIDVYYDLNSANNNSFAINDGKDSLKKWKAITPTLVAETVEGETVSTVFDIPANANPVTDLDLAKYLPLTGGKMTGIISTNNDLAKVTPSPTGLIGGGHAQGIIFLNKDDAEFGTFGAMGTGGTFDKFYIGFGNNAWENGNGLEIKPASIKWKGSNLVTDLDLTIDAIQGLRAELNELRSLITNS